jgi:hypothetical protein
MMLVLQCRYGLLQLKRLDEETQKSSNGHLQCMTSGVTRRYLVQAEVEMQRVSQSY